MSVAVALLLYKLAVILAGCLALYLGYLLFRHGVFAPAGDLDARFGDHRLVLKQAAPGIFFALFGTAVLSFTIAKGFVLEAGGPQLSRGQRNLIASILIHIDQDETLDRETRTQFVSALNDVIKDPRTGGRGLASE